MVHPSPKLHHQSTSPGPDVRTGHSLTPHRHSPHSLTHSTNTLTTHTNSNQTLTALTNSIDTLTTLTHHTHSLHSHTHLPHSLNPYTCTGRCTCCSMEHIRNHLVWVSRVNVCGVEFTADQTLGGDKHGRCGSLVTCVVDGGWTISVW